jgi:hypothetical protein
MIAINLLGGLGNVMFQIATIEYLGKAFGQEVCYTDVDKWMDDLVEQWPWSQHGQEYLSIFPAINFYKNHTERFIPQRKQNVQFRFTQLGAQHGDLFTGYFQSEKNFPDRPFVENLFRPADRVLGLMAKYDVLFNVPTCSISVRRGNYRNLENFHPCLRIDYYQKAIDIMKTKGASRFLVFSNDLNWCRNNFIGDEFVFVSDIDYVELFLMSKCANHIISNSSYAWWGAWLGETPAKTIIAPSVWFGNYLPAEHDADIIPERWLKI